MFLWSSTNCRLLTDMHISSGNELHCSSSGQEMPKLDISPSQSRLAFSQNDLQGHCACPASH